MSRELSLRKIGEKGKMSKYETGSSSRRYPVASFKDASEHMIEQGVTTLISLKGDNLSTEVECMAAEFKEIIKGEIVSAVSPITLRLKEIEGTTRVEIGNLQKVMDVMKGNVFPFYRIEKLGIMYVPLFTEEEEEGGTITFSIQDSSIKVGTRSKVISEATVPLGKMSMIELSSPYFVQRKDIGVIRFGYKAKGVKVTGRSFASVLLAFYIHKDQVPALVMKKEPIVLLIDDIETPSDLNKTSSIKSLCDKVNKRIEKKKIALERARIENQLLLDNRNASAAIISDGSDEPGEGIEIESLLQRRRSDPQRVEELNIEVFNNIEKEVKMLLPRGVKVWKIEGAILDTGAPDHWFYHPSLSGMENLTGSGELLVGKNVISLKGVEVKLGSHWVKLKEVLYGRRDHMPLISMKKLQQGGVVDTLKYLDSGRAILCCKGVVVFELDNSGSYLTFVPSILSSEEMIIEGGIKGVP